ncbi:MAG TPA: MarR family transcriptional regulator [Acidimicrobiales bacterium]|nr:MarR family transcriptional regulator [Acidimicrobiales bacterium]
MTVETGVLTPLDEVRLAMVELFGAERRLRGREQQQPREMTHSQLRALMLLGTADEVPAGELARRADLNPASVTAMLDQLEANGIVERRRHASDRRVCLVSLTDKGRAIVSERRNRWHALWEEHLGDLSEDELRSALRVMRRMIELLDGS